MEYELQNRNIDIIKTYFQYTEKNILDYINNNKMIRINVRQGYSK
jgi:hypothetical protein